MIQNFLYPTGVYIFLLFTIYGCGAKEEEKQLNILFCISDDQTWLHTSIMGAKEVHTPNFDKVAAQGVLFTNAYCAASSCAPSRAAILTGQEIWRLEEGGLLFGGLPNKFMTFTEKLRENGYATARTGKGYAPANQQKENYWKAPIGTAYNDITTDTPKGISKCDYAGNFRQFIEERNPDQPFFFWYGGYEPHRVYKEGIGAEAGKDLSEIEVPGFLPDNHTIRNDIADYYHEIEWFDQHLGKMIDLLEETGELENTIIIVTADNGMPFPRSKTTCYEYGTHMPLAVSWGNKIKSNRKIEDFISFTDFAPTLLEAAGISVPEDMTGKSFLDLLTSEKDGKLDPERNRVFTALERHTYCRPGGRTYPIRTIRKDEWVYILNFEPERWPAGNPDFYSPHQGFYGDVDAGPTREYMIENKDHPEMKPYFALSFGKRPQEELYNISEDPYQLNNLALDNSFSALKNSLKQELMAYLKDTKDPRVKGEAPWDDYPYYFKGFEERHTKPINERDTLIDGILQ